MTLPNPNSPTPHLGGQPNADTAPQASRRFRELIGLNVKFSQGQPLSDLPTLSELGVRWVRDTVDWATLEPKPGQFIRFPSDFARRLEFYKSHGIGVVFLLAYENNVAYPATRSAPLRPLDPVTFGRYAVEVAKQLRTAGVDFVLEIWNEPHNFVIRPLLSGSWNGKPPAPWLEHYLKMVREVVRQVKALDSSIQLLSDDDMWVIHYWYLEQGLPAQLDGFAFHPYTQASPERTAVDHDTDWVHPFTVVDADGSFQSAVRRLREHGRRKLGRTPELWVTEWGWPIGQQSPLGPMTEDLLAAWLPRAYVIAAAAGVRAVCWFSARDSVDGPMGLITNSGRKRKPYYALKALSKQLGESVFAAQVIGGDHPTRGVQAFRFDTAQSSKLVVWSLDSKPSKLQLRDALTNATVVDRYGERVEPSTDSTGVPYLVLENSPYYLETAPQLDNSALRALLVSEARVP